MCGSPAPLPVHKEICEPSVYEVSNDPHFIILGPELHITFLLELLLLHEHYRTYSYIEFTCELFGFCLISCTLYSTYKLFPLTGLITGRFFFFLYVALFSIQKNWWKAQTDWKEQEPANLSKEKSCHKVKVTKIFRCSYCTSHTVGQTNWNVWWQFQSPGKQTSVLHD